MERALVLFDADCGFCSWSVNKLVAWDQLGGRSPSIRAVAIQSKEGGEWLADLGPAERLASWHLVNLDSHRRLSAGDAIPPALHLMPFGALPAFFANLIPPLTRRAYWWVADHRDDFGRLLGVQACRVPQPPEHESADVT